MVIYPVLVPVTVFSILVELHGSGHCCLSFSEKVWNGCEPDYSYFCLSVSFPFFLPQSLIEAHDKVAAKCFEMPLAMVNSDAQMTSSLMPADAVRMIGIQKKAGEPLVS